MLSKPGVTEGIASVLLDAQRYLVRHRHVHGAKLLRTLSVANPLRPKKSVYAIDHRAEVRAAVQLEQLLGRNNMRIVAEAEMTQALDLGDEPRPVILLDALDGTDLFLRGYGNWCSTAIVFEGPDILGTFVAFDGAVYAALRGQGHALQIVPGDKGMMSIQRLYGTSRVRRIADATICCYAQRPRQALALWKQQRLYEELDDLPVDARLRFYNFAGNPMMVRMVAGPVKVDAVFDVYGQPPHDFVPGAFIAAQAGAYVLDLSTRQVADLARGLFTPGHDKVVWRYVIAANEGLARDISQLLDLEDPLPPDDLPPFDDM
jgi:fructose-1,6-bisphosphatase/inositol monophosphatase family enzyme